MRIVSNNKLERMRVINKIRHFGLHLKLLLFHFYLLLSGRKINIYGQIKIKFQKFRVPARHKRVLPFVHKPTVIKVCQKFLQKLVKAHGLSGNLYPPMT